MEQERRRPWAKLVLGIVAIVLALILTIQNMRPVEFQIFFWKQSISPALLVPITFLLGVFAARFLR